MDAYRDTHGHFVSKGDNGEQCPHNDGKFMNGLRKGLEGKTVEAHGAELKAPNKWLNATDEEIEEAFSDNELTKGTRVGGYVGLSRSRSAEASEAQGSKPISKWTRDDLLEELLLDDSLEQFREELEGLSFAALKRVALYGDGWHHTGKFATQTDFYAVDSPSEIVKRLRDEKNGTLDRDRLKKLNAHAPSPWEMEQTRKWFEQEGKREEEGEKASAEEYSGIEGNVKTMVDGFKREISEYAKANKRTSKAGNTMIDVQRARTDGYETKGSPTNLGFIKKGIVGEPNGYPRIDIMYNPSRDKVEYIVARESWDESTYGTPEEAYKGYHRARNDRLASGLRKGFN